MLKILPISILIEKRTIISDKTITISSFPIREKIFIATKRIKNERRTPTLLLFLTFLFFDKFFIIFVKVEFSLTYVRGRYNNVSRARTILFK